MEESRTLRNRDQLKRKEFFDPTTGTTTAGRKPKKTVITKQSDPLWNVASGSFIVKAIVAQKVVNHRNFTPLLKFEYQVRWEGYSAARDLWLPYENVKHLSELQSYISQHYELKAASKQALNDSFLEDSEEEDVLENKAAELLEFIRGR